MRFLKSFVIRIELLWVLTWDFSTVEVLEREFVPELIVHDFDAAFLLTVTPLARGSDSQVVLIVLDCACLDLLFTRELLLALF